MDPVAFTAVLLAAVFHASWNALVKSSADPVAQMTILNFVGSCFGGLVVLMVGWPESPSWPYLVGSILVHQLYYAFLILGYRNGDLSEVYPIARGVAPLLVAVGAFMFAGEALSSTEVFAVCLISGGILYLAFGRRALGAPTRSLMFALLTGVSIALYTVIDGLGGRHAGDVIAYIGALFLIEGLPITTYFIATRRGRTMAAMRPIMTTGFAGGLLSTSAYGIVIWAMSTNYMTFVSALRETSVVMAAMIGAWVLKEPLGGRRITGACIVAAGVVWLHLN